MPTDEYLSAEHVLLALVNDERCGKGVFGPDLSTATLRAAIDQARGNKRITSRNPEVTYEALAKYSKDLTALAKEGKLDPVIGRDDEVRGMHILIAVLIAVLIALLIAVLIAVLIALKCPHTFPPPMLPFKPSRLASSRCAAP